MSRALDEGGLAARLHLHAEGGLRRVQLEIHGEQVTFLLRDGRVHTHCTCGLADCEHLATALRFLGETPGQAEARPRSSLRPPPPSPSADLAQLGQALEELILAVARAGVASPDSPSIRAALDQLLALAGTPAPLGLSRFVARLSEALVTGEVSKIARVLDGARLLADELIAGERSPLALSRRRTWFAHAEGVPHEPLTDATLVEVARERLAGLTRASIERRYLLDLASGEVLKEERRVGDHDVSVGPCPRVVHVAFAEIESGALPRRVRLLQYTIGAQPSEEHWARIGEHSVHSVRELLLRHGEGARVAPGQAEPFVLFAPRALGSSSDTRLSDVEGDSLLLDGEAEASFASVVHAATGSGELLWVGGRLLGLARGLVLRPACALVRHAHGHHLCRIA